MRACLQTLTLGLISCLLLGVGLSLAASRDVDAPYGGNCKACHSTRRVLPQGHVETKEMKWKSCAKCHTPGTGQLNLAGQIPLSHLHGLREISCKMCHEPGSEKNPLVNDACVKCHGSLAEMAKRKWVRLPNPHDSHYPDLQCTFCHHAHKASENFCLQCHDYGHRIP